MVYPYITSTLTIIFPICRAPEKQFFISGNPQKKLSLTQNHRNPNLFRTENKSLIEDSIKVDVSDDFNQRYWTLPPLWIRPQIKLQNAMAILHQNTPFSFLSMAYISFFRYSRFAHLPRIQLNRSAQNHKSMLKLTKFLIGFRIFFEIVLSDN